MDSSVSISGKMERPPAGVAEYLNGSPQRQDRRCRVGALRWTFVADKEVVKERAQWRDPELKSRMGPTHPSVVEGAGYATPAWAAEECHRVLGQ